jgi:hypothetical protein
MQIGNSWHRVIFAAIHLLNIMQCECHVSSLLVLVSGEGAQQLNKGARKIVAP